MTKRLGSCVVICVLLLIVTGCSDSDDDNNAGSQLSSCDLVTKSEAEAIFGEPVSEPRTKPVGASTGCELRATNGTTKATILVLAGVSNAKERFDQLQADDINQPVPTLDFAICAQQDKATLHLLQGTELVRIETDSCTRAGELAAVASSKFPAPGADLIEDLVR